VKARTFKTKKQKRATKHRPSVEALWRKLRQKMDKPIAQNVARTLPSGKKRVTPAGNKSPSFWSMIKATSLRNATPALERGTALPDDPRLFLIVEGEGFME
jgi:hypothetical protein